MSDVKVPVETKPCWLNHQEEDGFFWALLVGDGKYAEVKLDHFPRDSGWKQKNMRNHHLVFKGWSLKSLRIFNHNQPSSSNVGKKYIPWIPSTWDLLGCEKNGIIFNAKVSQLYECTILFGAHHKALVDGILSRHHCSCRKSSKWSFASSWRKGAEELTAHSWGGYFFFPLLVCRKQTKMS